MKSTTNNRIKIASAHVIVFAAIVALSFLASVHTADAALITKFTVPAYCNQPNKECGWVDLVRLGSEVLSFGVYIAILGATGVMVMAGWKIMMNQGSESEVKAGKKMLWAAITGIVVTMCAYMLVQFILTKLGVISGVRLFI